MRLIFFKDDNTASQMLWPNRWTRIVLYLCGISIPLFFVGFGYVAANLVQLHKRDNSLQVMQDAVSTQGLAVGALRADTLNRLQAMNSSVMEMDARLLSLNALGQYLTSQLSGVEDIEVMDWAPAQGGPLQADPELPQINISTELEGLSELIAEREERLEVLQYMLDNWQASDGVILSGKPVAKGWLSSGYGRRKDPITGERAWHNGVDYSGVAGSDILAVAPGLVVWSGPRYQYGKMVEISHGGGYTTRYAHNRENLVTVGELVQQGQVIAKMGTTGRSTGPHVHYEIVKDDRSLDPIGYIARTER